MAFKTTEDNYLQVTAFAKGLQNLSAVHLNADVFATAVRVAGIEEPIATELNTAATEAYLQPGRDVCCEVIDINLPQMGALCLLPTKDEFRVMLQGNPESPE